MSDLITRETIYLIEVIFPDGGVGHLRAAGNTGIGGLWSTQEEAFAYRTCDFLKAKEPANNFRVYTVIGPPGRTVDEMLAELWAHYKESSA
jgi:hypothetical protein